MDVTIILTSCTWLLAALTSFQSGRKSVTRVYSDKLTLTSCYWFSSDKLHLAHPVGGFTSFHVEENPLLEFTQPAPPLIRWVVFFLQMVEAWKLKLEILQIVSRGN